MRISRTLTLVTWLVGPIICVQTAAAQALVEQKVGLDLAAIETTVETSYLRSVADPDSAYYQSIAAAGFELALPLPNEASLKLTTGVSRDLDALEELNVWSSTSLAYGHRPIELAPDLSLLMSGAVVLPTNSIDRDYLSYQGSVDFGAGLKRVWNQLGLVKSIKLALSGGGVRNFFQYDASKAGDPNTMYSLSSTLGAAVDLNSILSFSGSYGLRRVQKTNYTWKDITFQQNVAATVTVNEQLSVSISEGTKNRALSYDAQTVQFALYDFQATVYEATATYTF